MVLECLFESKVHKLQCRDFFLSKNPFVITLLTLYEEDMHVSLACTSRFVRCVLHFAFLVHIDAIIFIRFAYNETVSTSTLLGEDER